MAVAQATPAALPKGWEEIITPEGERALVPDSRNRRAQARLVGVLALATAAGALAAGSASMASPGLIPGAIFALLATAGLVWGTVWLARGRMEWKIGGGRITLRRRFGSTLKDEFEADRLEIVTTSDSDGDEWYTLDAVHGETAPATTPKSIVEASQYRGRNRRRIATVIHDPTVPMRLGAWLSRAAGIPIEDKTTTKARQVEITVLKGQLDASGPLGKFALKLIEKAEAKQAGRPDRVAARGFRASRPRASRASARSCSAASLHPAARTIPGAGRDCSARPPNPDRARARAGRSSPLRPPGPGPRAAPPG
jgi:hypothetical protein